jgi:hypothetical protein
MICKSLTHRHMRTLFQCLCKQVACKAFRSFVPLYKTKLVITLPMKNKKSLPKTALAMLLGVSRTTLTKYLAMPGAPKPDNACRFSLEPVKRWIEERAPRAGESPGTKRLRAERLRLQTAAIRRDLDALRLRHVAREEIEPTLKSVLLTLRQELELWFLEKLPPRWAGLSVIEIQQQNAEGVDAVANRIRTGQWSGRTPAPAGFDQSAQAEQEPTDGSDPTRALRARKLAAEVDLLAFYDAIEKGSQVPGVNIEKVVVPAIAAAAEANQRKFEWELPFRHAGKSASQVLEMYREAIGKILEQLCAQLAPLLGKSKKAAA